MPRREQVTGNMLTARLSSRRIELAEVRPRLDTAALHAAVARLVPDGGDDAAVFLGTLPEHADAVSAQFTVHRADVGAEIGLACLSDCGAADAIQANLLLNPASAPYGMGLEATVLLLDHAFASWPVRLVRFPVPAVRAKNFSLPAIISENTPPPHDRRELPCELKVFSIHRAPWEKFGTQLLTRLRRGPSDQ